jgi:hypothetical protein
MSQGLQYDRSSDPTAGAEATFFPSKLFVDFLEFLMDYRKRVEIIAYHDLTWSSGFDYIRNYPDEKRSGRSGVPAAISIPKRAVCSCSTMSTPGRSGARVRSSRISTSCLPCPPAQRAPPILN